MPSISVIVTVRNEAQTIAQLLQRLAAQTQLPSEVIITDADSSDQTVHLIQDFAHKNSQIPVHVFRVPGNRSSGRNQAIKHAKNDLIAITDAGCIPDVEWLESLADKYATALASSETPVHYPVVAGYAVATGTTDFERAVIPFFLPMPDRIDPKSYVPTTRSLLIHKDTWKRVGGFDESFNTSEDFLFSHALIRNNVPIHFAEKATVQWSPPSSYLQTIKTFATFAACDVTGEIVRPKVVVLFGRYILGAILCVVLARFFGLEVTLFFIATVLFFYSIWAMAKHRRYVKRGLYWQPILQLSADVAVMAGSLWGTIIWVKNRIKIQSRSKIYNSPA